MKAGHEIEPPPSFKEIFILILIHVGLMLAPGPVLAPHYGKSVLEILTTFIPVWLVTSYLFSRLAYWCSR